MREGAEDTRVVGGRRGGKVLRGQLGIAGDPEQAWVLQAATRLPVYEFPVAAPDGRMFGEPFYTVMGFAATDNGLGILCRVSQKQVVNVAQRGGLAAVFVTDTPPDLRIPKRPNAHGDNLEQTLRDRIKDLRHLDRVIAMGTVNAARSIPALKEFGTLRVGSAADVSIFELAEGSFDFVDNLNAKKTGKQKRGILASRLSRSG